MGVAIAPLPPGYTQICLAAVDSTNAEALRRAARGADGNLWIRAARQTSGRGRLGRRWVSGDGNLFASLLLRPPCALETCLQLAFVAGLAAFDAVSLSGGPAAGRLSLKWPNDLLLDGAKLGGVLLESGGDGKAPVIVIGTGLNLAAHPAKADLPATDLAAHGLGVSTDEAFSALAGSSARWLEVWGAGAGWPRIRAAWAERALPEGTAIRVRDGVARREGRYGGIAEDGALLLVESDGGRRRITAGDVFPS